MKKIFWILIIIASVLTISIMAYPSDKKITTYVLSSFNLKEMPLLNAGTGDIGSTEKDKCIEVLVKTSDNIPSKIPRGLWTQEIINKDASGNAKVGNVIRYEDCGFEWGNLEKDPKNFMILRMNQSQFNESLMVPIYETVRIDKETTEQRIIKFREYTLNLSSILATKELSDLSSIKYNEILSWNIEKNLTASINDKIIDNNLNRTYDVKHGSAGTFTICASGCSYTNLQTWETAQDSDITGTGNSTAVIMGNFNDTASLDIAGWTSTINDWIVVMANISTYRANATYDVNKFNLISTDATVMTIREDFVHINGIQIENKETTAVDKDDVYVYGQITPNIILLENLLIKGNNGIYRQSGIKVNNNNTILKIYNTVLFGFSDTMPKTYPINIIANNMTYIYSTTIINGIYGIFQTTAPTRTNLKNVIITNQTTGSIFYTTTENTTANYVSTYDGKGDDFGGTGNRINQGFNFVSPLTGNYHLLSTDTGALDFGVDLSSDGNISFNTDIDKETRTGTWDIGCDEYIVPTAGLCTGTSNCIIDCTANPIVSANFNNGGYNLTCSGAGTITFNANYTNVDLLQTKTGCLVICKAGNCFKRKG